jgi:hypothetical protein
MIVLPGAGVPVYRPAPKDRNAITGILCRARTSISRPLPAREEDAVLNSEIVLQVLKDMSSLVGDISELTSQIELWPEPRQQPIEFYHTGTASRMDASAVSVANRGRGLLLAFRPRKAVLHSDSVVFEADVPGLIDERGSAAGLHDSIANESSSGFIHRFPGEKARYKR